MRKGCTRCDRWRRSQWLSEVASRKFYGTKSVADTSVSLSAEPAMMFGSAPPPFKERAPLPATVSSLSYRIASVRAHVNCGGFKMSHRSKPPRQSADARGPKVVRTHANVKSVGTHKRRGRQGAHHPIDVKTERDWNDPELKFPNGSPGSGSGPGSSGPPTTGSIGPGGVLGST